MIWTNKPVLFLSFTLFLFSLYSRSYCIRFPDISYFPILPNYSFSLISGKSNTLDVSMKIEIPRDEEIYDKFFLNCLIVLNIDKEKLIYSLRFTLMTNGDVYLTEMRDSAFQRSFPPDILIFPVYPSYDKPVVIGENISLKYSKSFGKMSEKDFKKVYNNVVTAELKLLDDPCLIYFSKDYGIVGIKARDEVFRRK